jgi:hypothetical protein
MIRLEGAEVLCNSLRTNRVLTNLDLSYNALGSAAAGVLGAALMENSVSDAGCYRYWCDVCARRLRCCVSEFICCRLVCSNIHFALLC